MSLVSAANEEDMEAFKESLFSCIPDYDEAINVLGTAVINAADNFTTCLQPITVEGVLVYGITSYGSTELLFVHEDDDYPLPENTDAIAETLPKGFRMALALESKIHLDIVRRYRLEQIKPTTKKYSAKMPYKVYHRNLQKQKHTQTLMGRIWLEILDIFDPV